MGKGLPRLALCAVLLAALALSGCGSRQTHEEYLIPKGPAVGFESPEFFTEHLAPQNQDLQSWREMAPTVRKSLRYVKSKPAGAVAIDRPGLRLTWGDMERTLLRLQELLPRLFREHQAVVFNGNGYSDEWPVEAARRGLPNLATTVDALERYNTPEVMDVFLRQNVLSEREMLARQEILLDTYAKTIAIEASLMLDMSRTQILPVALQEQAAAADLVLKTRAVSTEAAMEEERFTCLRGHTVGLNAALSALEQQLAALRAAADAHTAARIARDGVVPAMQACREHCDALERMLNAAVWPLPSYAEMLWLH